MRARQNFIRRVLAGFSCGLVALGLLAARTSAGPFDMSHYLYVGSDPDDERLEWADQAQGIGHDATHWYLAQRAMLWRAPVSVDLGALTATTPGVSTLRLDSVQELRDDGYNHFGDLVCFEHGGHGYVLVPIETGGERAGVAAFRADATLTYLDHINLYPDPLSHQSHWSWAGLDPQGRLYSSTFDDVDHLVRYEVDWDHLDATGELFISNETAEEIPLLGPDGPLTIDRVQGGELTPGGELLYMLTGYPTDQPTGHGIHVFETTGFHRVAKSDNGVGPFNYEFSGPPSGDEPEGLTIWDLEGTASPHRGQLHAMLLDSEFGAADKIYIKHYTDVIMADWRNNGSQTGTPELPFKTIQGGLNLAWGGAEVRARPGTYPENLTITQCVRLSAQGGLVRIGQ